MQHKILTLLVALFLVACGKNSSGDKAASVSPPTQRSAVSSSTPFSGRMYVEAYEVGKPFNSCVIGADGWDCTHPVSDCWNVTGVTMPGDFWINGTDQLSLDGTFGPTTYQNGQYVLTNSGYTLDLEWFGSYADEGVVVTVFSVDGTHQCSEHYFVGGE